MARSPAPGFEKPAPGGLGEAAQPALRPAAQYIRMSSDSQDISPAVQRSAIAEYARSHGLCIVASYEDAGRSGVTIGRRPSMRRLIQDVAADRCPFRVVLVYDVSRWGRFSDPDEAAYYEYHCRLHGVDVHYVGEVFAPELTLTTALLKSMKRVMAAEYSRELGVKSRAGQSRVIELGYQMGLLPCLGFRRIAIAADGSCKRLLEDGERKPAATDRIRWVFGPEREVELVRTIFRLYVTTKLSMRKIAELLNSQGERTARGNRFTEAGIAVLLNCEAYVGNFVWGRRVHNPRRRQRADTDPAVSRRPAALPPMVDPQTWEAARRKRSDPRACRRSNQEVLQSLRDALRRQPDLKERELVAAGCEPGASYRRRFGSFLAAAELAVAGRDKRLVEVRNRMGVTRALVRRVIHDVLELLQTAGVPAARALRQYVIVLGGGTRIPVQVLWRKDFLDQPRWQVKKRICGEFQYALFVRMQDAYSAADFVLLTASEYFDAPWSLELEPYCGVRCTSGQQLVDTLRLL